MKRLPTMLLAAWALTCPLVLAGSVEEEKAIKVLRSAAIPAEKEAACRQLKRIGTAKSVPALTSLLADDLLAQWALDVLETMPCPEAGQALRAALRATVRKPKVGVVHALGERRDRAAVPDLIDLLGDPEVMVATAAAEAIGKIGGCDAVDALDKARATASGPVRHATVDGLLACADRLRADGKVEAASAIYKRLCDSKEAEHVRVAAHRGMVLSSGNGAIARLVDGLKGRDTAAQLASLQLVQELEAPGATEASVTALSGATPKVQAALLDALAGRGDAAAASAAASAVKSPNAAVRLAALKALGVLGDASHVPLLAEVAVGGTDAERTAARFSLVCLRRGDVRRAMLALVAESHPEIQGKVIAVLGSRGERKAVPELLKLAAAGKEPTNIAAVSALKKLADASHAEALLGLMIGANSDAMRQAAQKTFVAVGARSKQPADFARRALDAMKGADVPMRSALLQTAGLLGGPGVIEALRAGVADPNPAIRRVAVHTMADHAGIEALPDLLKIAQETSDADQRAAALRGYWRLVGLVKGDSPAQHLKRVHDGLAAGKEPDQKRHALAELAKIPLPEAMALAQQSRSDDAVKTEAEAACYHIATRLVYSHRAEVESTLRRLAKDAGSESVRKDAGAFVASLAKYADYVVPWLVSPPYRQKGKEAQGLFDVVFAPEKPGAPGVKWQLQPAPPKPANFWQADFTSVVGGNHCVVYAKTKVYCPKAQPIALEIGTDDGVKLWINGKLVHANNAVRGMAPGQDKAKGVLKRGWNDFLAKITQHTLGCGLIIRTTAADGSRIDGLRFDPEGKATMP